MKAHPRSPSPRLLFAAALAAFLVTSASALFAAQKTEVDASSRLAPVASAASNLKHIQTDRDLRALGKVSQVDDRFGVPTFVWASRPAPIGSSLAKSPNGPEQAARAHLEALAPLYRLARADVSTAQVRYIRDTGRGGIVVSFRQNIDGIDVFRDEVKVLMDRNKNLIASSGYIASKAELGKTGAVSFRMSETEALSRALEDFSGGSVSRGAIRSMGEAAAGYRKYDVSAAAPTMLRENTVAVPARVKQVLFHEPGSLSPAYYVELTNEKESYSYVISANDGGILFRHSLTESDSYTYRVWADNAGLHTPFDGPQGNDPTPHPTGTPNNFNPVLLAPGLQTLQNGPISTNDPWLPPGSTETVGNNVDAYADLNTPDGLSPGDFRANTTSPGTFDRTYDTTQPPNVSQDQQKAAITQLFYNNNYFHDWYYDAGFNEAAGNAQLDNYGRGGVPGDPVHAEAEDFSGTNNANMSTPSDGGSPRMQMYIFTPSVQKITVNSPAVIAGDYQTGNAAFGPQQFDLTADVVLVSDPVAPTSNGCETPYTNAAAVAGKIAFIDRGTCTFAFKVKTAQDNGAIGVIIGNNAAGIINMAGVDPTITIPALSVSLADANTIKAQLASTTVNARMVRAPGLVRDGAIDNQIVAHEWGHYISNRLIGDAAGLTTNQSRGMGEGWGDFHAMLMTVREQDALAPANANYSGVYGLAGYALSIDIAPDNAYYFGIRRVPYSTDMSKDGLTFQHITNGVPLPVGPPTAFGQDGASNAEVHNTGEIWCTMLWECYAALLRDVPGRFTFDQARNRMRDYLVAAYMMTPNQPTFTEARDAVLAAAFANDITDYQEFCEAFAKRGAGTGAIAPDRNSTDNSGVVESYQCGGDLIYVSSNVSVDLPGCDGDSYIDNGETGTVTLTLRNVGSSNLSNTTATVTSSNPHVSFPAGNVMSLPPSTPFSQTTGTLQIALNGAVGAEVIDLQISFNDPGLIVAGPRPTPPLDDWGNVDEAPSATETVEEHNPTWTIAGTPDPGAEFGRSSIGTGAHDFYGPDNGAPDDEYLITPPLNVALVGSLSFTFKHAYAFERDATNFYDGGVLELSNDNGSTWVDIGAFAAPTYGTTPIFTGSGSVISGRLAYEGTSPGYPAFGPVTVNVGPTYNGQTVLVRFREAQDVNGGNVGWDIDDIAFSGITNQPFITLVPDAHVRTTTTSNVTPTPNPAKFGTKVELTATVTPASATGIVTFSDQNGPIGQAPVVGGSATLSVTNLSTGPHDLTASYGGSSCYDPSASPNPVTLSIIPDNVPAVQVIFPNGGENFIVGGDVKLIWTASDDNLVTSVTLSVSRDNGATYQDIAIDIPNTGSFVWNVSPPGTNTGAAPNYTALFRVRAKDNANQIGEDSSDNPFSIFDVAVPVLLSRFETSSSQSGAIAVRWTLMNPDLFTTIAVERADAQTGPWTAVAAPQTQQGDVTVAIDRTVVAGRNYWYRLVASTNAGTQAIFGPVSGIADAPKAFELSRTWPNPTAGDLHAEFAVAKLSNVRLSLIDLQGREMRVLASGLYAPGRYQVTWNGRQDRGGMLAAGVYFLRLHTVDKDFVTRVAVTH